MKWLEAKMMNKQLSLRVLAVFLVLAISASCAKSVRSSPANDDATITVRVKTAFVNDPTVGIQKIDVSTFKGVVTLSGRAETKEVEQKAIDLARKIRGVVDVQSKVTIGG